jgi:hypothetical protein
MVNRMGRPRKHGSAAERIRAFRIAHDLQKVTLDVPTCFAAQLRQYARLLRQFAGQNAISDNAVSTLILRPTRKKPASSPEFALPKIAASEIELTRDESLFEKRAKLEITSLRWLLKSRYSMELEWPSGNVRAVIRRGDADEKSSWIWYIFSGATSTFPARGRDNSLRRAKLLAELALMAFATGIYEGNPTVDDA